MNIECLKKDLPIIIISELAYKKMQAYVRNSEYEIGWLGSVKKNKNIYTITDVYLLKQEVNGTTCELDPASISELYEDRISKGLPNDIFFWGHSHVNMATSPSGQDNSQFMEFYENNDYFIRLIMNKRDDINLSLFDKEQELLYTNIVPIIEDSFDDTEIINEIKEKVSKKVYPTYPQPYQSQLLKKTKKENEKTRNIYDDYDLDDYCENDYDDKFYETYFSKYGKYNGSKDDDFLEDELNIYDKFND